MVLIRNWFLSQGPLPFHPTLSVRCLRDHPLTADYLPDRVFAGCWRVRLNALKHYVAAVSAA